ncbi:hypothetical protein [Microvirga puerhi]|uniref:Uncharacterized protein n=1 Tax=Microvirga puerhi TaxID=2876078 RepID=A0ABS7VHG0_9HYPH|nr:hypothetical protein [Microvirga puerhi]MBZ6074946.1 hypothetical protein [Microvirga puerhi]
MNAKICGLIPGLGNTSGHHEEQIRVLFIIHRHAVDDHDRETDSMRSGLFAGLTGQGFNPLLQYSDRHEDEC